MPHDLQEIKDRLDLAELFRRDGHELRRAGGNFFCRCPFHEEKTASCKVGESRFKCFGCSASGDVFDYWERSRGLSARDAFDELARVAGVAEEVPGFHKPHSTPRPKPKPQDEKPDPLTSAEIAEWMADTRRLAGQPGEIGRIAAWRGISEDTVRWAAGHGIMGLRHYYGAWREAFLVEAPDAPSGPATPVSVHIRLAPHTRGNPHPKQSWRFTPSGRGSWPLVIGSVPRAASLFLVEGQWDALALIDVMGWSARWPDDLAVVAMRGASSFPKFLHHYALHEKATAFAIADADAAGSRWYEPGGFIESLQDRVSRVHSYLPGESGRDLNDLVRAGLTRADLLSLLYAKLRDPRRSTPSGPTFLIWCRRHKDAPGGLGRAARCVIADKGRPKGRRPLKAWKRHWRKLELSEDLVSDLLDAWATWKSECQPLSKAA